MLIRYRFFCSYIGGTESEGHFSLINEACSMLVRYCTSEICNLQIFEDFLFFSFYFYFLFSGFILSERESTEVNIYVWFQMHPP